VFSISGSLDQSKEGNFRFFDNAFHYCNQSLHPTPAPLATAQALADGKGQFLADCIHDTEVFT
jgi:hypothetical protein